MASKQRVAGVRGRPNAPTRCPAHLELQAKVDRILADADPIDLRDPALDLTLHAEVGCVLCDLAHTTEGGH